MSEIKLPALYRVLDATTNRGREAIRVIEDVVRFVCNDGSITAELKAVRHEFTALTNTFSREERLKYRETEGDVGTSIQAKGEYLRQSLNEVLAANFSRFQESLRSIEEFAKMAWPDVSLNIEHLRYLSYTLEKEVFARLVDVERRGIHQKRLEQINQHPIFVLVDTSCTVAHFSSLCHAGIGAILLCDTKATDPALLSLARSWQSVLADPAMEQRPLLLMSQRADLAILAGFDGIYLAPNDLPAAEVRTIIGSEMLIGCSLDDSVADFLLTASADTRTTGTRTTTSETSVPVFSPTSDESPEPGRVVDLTRFDWAMLPHFLARVQSCLSRNTTTP